MKRYWNKFLNWLIPGRRSRLLAKIMKMDQDAGLYESKECCGNWDEYGICCCKKLIKND